MAGTDPHLFDFRQLDIAGKSTTRGCRVAVVAARRKRLMFVERNGYMGCGTGEFEGEQLEKTLSSRSSANGKPHYCQRGFPDSDGRQSGFN